MLHDLLRELAIYQSSQEPIEQRKRLIVDLSGDKVPNWWTQDNQQPFGARLLSISTGWPSISLSLNMIKCIIYGTLPSDTF